jgi:hypothetical protein
MKNVKTNLFFLSLALLAGTASAQDAMSKDSMAAHDAMTGSMTAQHDATKKASDISKDGDHMMASHAMAAAAAPNDAGHMMAGHAMAASGAMGK